MTLNPQPEQGNEYNSLKRSAAYLGLRYDQNKQKVDTSERLLKDISKNFEDFVWAPQDNVCHKQMHCSSTTDDSNEKIESHLKLPFTATYQGIKLGAKYSTKTTGKLANLSGAIVYTVFRIDSRQCTYKQIPSLNLLQHNDKKDRGTYVKAVWMNTWYKINFIIKFENKEKKGDVSQNYS